MEVTKEINIDLPKVSVIIVNYNGGELLLDCIASVLQQNYPDFEILLIDNASCDGSVEAVEKKFDPVKIIRSNANLGFGQGNNLGADTANGEYLAFLNPDTTVDPGWLIELIQMLLENPEVGLATSKILISSSPDKINTCGNNVHFTGMPACRGWMQDADAIHQVMEVCSISGAAFVVKKEIFDRIGGFDEHFFLYAEDTDLSWRMRLAGYRCVCVPASIVYHRYAPVFGEQKYFYLERNRYQVLLKNYQWKTLVLLIPALMLTELVTWGYAFLNGWKHVKAKLRSYGWLLSNLSNVLQTRKAVQGKRVVKDRCLLQACTHHMEFGLAGVGLPAKIASAVFDPIFYLLFHLTLILVRW